MLAAGGTQPRAISRGHDEYRALLDAMHEGRRRRLTQAGFSAAQAEVISDLHTPSFM